MLIQLLKIINKFVYKLWYNYSSHGHNIEHKKQLFWALLNSIIGKNLSIIGWGLIYYKLQFYHANFAQNVTHVRFFQ